MTELEWAKAKKKCTLWSYAILNCDGFKVSLKEDRCGNKIVIQIFVNDYIRGSWFFTKEGETEAEELKFYPRKQCYVHSKKQRDWYKKLTSKILKESLKSTLDKHEKVCLAPSSFEIVKRHLKKVCKEISFYEAPVAVFEPKDPFNYDDDN
jgi:hypothetical protein